MDRVVSREMGMDIEWHCDHMGGKAEVLNQCVGGAKIVVKGYVEVSVAEAIPWSYIWNLEEKVE